MEVPTLNNLPKLLPAAYWIWRGFEILSDKRAFIAEIAQPISMEAITAYVDYERVTDEADRDNFLYLVSKLDQVWRKHWQERYRARKEQERRQREREQRRRR